MLIKNNVVICKDGYLLHRDSAESATQVLQPPHKAQITGIVTLTFSYFHPQGAAGPMTDSGC